MAYEKADYVYVIVVTFLFISQLYCWLTSNRDVLLSILFPMAIIFTFIIGIKRMFNKKAMREEEGTNETSEGETIFRILFVILNFITFIICIMYLRSVPRISLREIKLTDEVKYVEVSPGIFKPIPICVQPTLKDIQAPKEVSLSKRVLTDTKDKLPEGTIPNVIEFNGRRYELLEQTGRLPKL